VAWATTNRSVQNSLVNLRKIDSGQSVLPEDASHAKSENKKEEEANASTAGGEK